MVNVSERKNVFMREMTFHRLEKNGRKAKLNKTHFGNCPNDIY